MGNVENHKQSTLAEHRFWLQILGDHARFILDALSPRETVEVERVQKFITVFDDLLTYARQTESSIDMAKLNEQADRYGMRIRNFTLHLLGRHLKDKLSMGVSPTFLNHMVNETEEYLRLLRFMKTGEVPPASHPVHHHVLWLQDAVGHADTIANQLDLVEKKLRTKSEGFTKMFEGLYLKAVELAGYLRTNLEQFPALRRFNREVELEMHLFRCFLAELEELELSDEALSALSPLMLDHMAREECYYLQKLSEVSDVHEPSCDPAKPRTDS